MRRLAAASALALVVLGDPEDSFPQAALPLPLPQGSTVITTLSFPEGERESFVNAKEVSPTALAGPGTWSRSIPRAIR